MKRNKSWILWFCLLTSIPFCPLKAQEGEAEFDLPCLWQILDTYYGYHAKGPDSLEELKSFIVRLKTHTRIEDYSCLPFLEQHILPQMEQYRERLRFQTNECSFELFLDSTRYASMVYPCCIDDSLIFEEERLVYLLNRVREELYAFDVEGKYLIERERLMQEWWKKMKKIYATCKINREETLFVEYRIGEGLYFCNNQPIEGIYSDGYWKNIHTTVKRICKKHRIARLLFYVYLPE